MTLSHILPERRGWVNMDSISSFVGNLMLKPSRWKKSIDTIWYISEVIRWFIFSLRALLRKWTQKPNLSPNLLTSRSQSRILTITLHPPHTYIYSHPQTDLFLSIRTHQCGLTYQLPVAGIETRLTQTPSQASNPSAT